ncbi:hypothetical protein DNH61_16690 [Paenibacillus sambharensis]|uniref:Anti-sigma regulatory factor n=1 Tax=Paenibacillus sambharensis TaxID=1803190 RepID=A0A2W1LRZ5_9BACL|nr:hypothetical protein [Paenibacillus sambharensis]PZD94601.1 hypothetical protein DNH61_16690 [Paenibacillus sambharensis]
METFLITKPSDAIRARQRVREMARTLGFGLVDQTKIAFTVSEFALKLISRADQCRMNLDYAGKEEGKTGIEVRLYEQYQSREIVDSDWAAQLVDDLDVNRNCSDETFITFRKWRTPTLAHESIMSSPVFAAGEEQ